MRQRVVKANAVAEKLEFVLRVVEQWTRNAGLGKLDDDEGTNVLEGELRWEGLMVGEAARKVDRVTVGRLGGDDVVR